VLIIIVLVVELGMSLEV